MGLMERRYPEPMSSLPTLNVPWSLRLRLWRKHRRLHKRLRNALMQHGERGDEMRCVHCGKGWRFVDTGTSQFIIDLPKR